MYFHVFNKNSMAGIA